MKVWINDINAFVIAKAAELCGKSLDDYVEDAALEIAHEDLARQQETPEPR